MVSFAGTIRILSRRSPSLDGRHTLLHRCHLHTAPTALKWKLSILTIDSVADLSHLKRAAEGRIMQNEKSDRNDVSLPTATFLVNRSQATRPSLDGVETKGLSHCHSHCHNGLARTNYVWDGCCTGRMAVDDGEPAMP
ncbi:hypothetical protein BLNAU_9832 [Blattamonas nauphoetae]|uniref:Uncharacterized protein n=1 Tax=Blattamonas nauphoetae TaxID=2049346 RepID=A0ABQ9XUY4_9EUKA|nr:hypothetical protein BLNAU_9832 [Blattamonas nauphoetae]